MTLLFVLTHVQLLVLVIPSRSLLIPARSISLIRIQRQQSQTNLKCSEGSGSEAVTVPDWLYDLKNGGLSIRTALFTFVQNDDKMYAVVSMY